MSSRTAPERRRWKRLIAIATATLSLSIGAGMLSVGGGVATGQSTGGGVAMPSPPQLDDVECLQMCAGIRRAGEGSLIRLLGRNLSNVQWVSFRTADGWRRVTPNYVAAQRVRATVPEGAVTGRVRAIDTAGNGTGTPNELQIVNQSALSDGGNFRLSEAQALPRQTYFFATANRQPKVTYVFNGDETTDVRVQVVRIGTGRIVRSFVQRARQPRTTYTARWNGRRNDGKLAGDGRFRFRIGAVGNGAAETTADARFRFYRHIFPVRGRPRGWGDGFGAGRGHQGQDIFARCGTPLVAARGGTVRWNRWQGAAGWYVVIAGRGTGRHYVYMHLQRRSPVKAGEVVRTGQRIGRVGATGNASGCHLHFELWSAPGWYQGGRPLPSVTRHMRRWASWS